MTLMLGKLFCTTQHFSKLSHLLENIKRIIDTRMAIP